MTFNPSLTAWEDESELALVCDWFYSERTPRDPYGTVDNRDMRKEAVATVNVWTFRSHKLAPAIIATADLTDSILHYEDLQRTANFNSYRSVQFMFAFAFLRFVNGFVDRDVAKSSNTVLGIGAGDNDNDTDEEQRSGKAAGESSMYAHAHAIGMPERFVDVRHQVTHGKVPEVKVLKKVADDALDWLWERWWKASATGDPSIARKRFERRNE